MQRLDPSCQRFIHARGSRHHHGAGATQIRRRLTKPAHRQQRAVQPGPRRIHQHQIQVACHCAVLEPVVKHQRVDRLHDLQQRLDRGNPICTDRDRQAGHGVAMLQHFIRHHAPAMTARGDGGRSPHAAKRFNHPAHHRRLARATGGDVAHRKHRHRRAPAIHAVQTRVAQPNRGAVHQRSGPCERRQHCRQRTTHAGHASSA